MQWVRPEIKLTGGISNGGKGTDLKQWFLNYDHRSSKFFHGIHEIKTIFIIVLRCYLLLKFLFSHELFQWHHNNFILKTDGQFSLLRTPSNEPSSSKKVLGIRAGLTITHHCPWCLPLSNLLLRSTIEVGPPVPMPAKASSNPTLVLMLPTLL